MKNFSKTSVVFLACVLVFLGLYCQEVDSCSSKSAQQSLKPVPLGQGAWKPDEEAGDHSGGSRSTSPNGHQETRPTEISQKETDDDEKASSSSSFPTNNNANSHHKTHKPLSLLHFANKSIQCNDKTPAGYYVRNSPLRNANTWIIFLEGGWFCFDERSCQNRWLRLKGLMSSAGWTHHKHVGGILSSDPNENPYWWNANHVFVPYCSSDTWSGTSRSGENGSKFSFMGALIVDEVVKTLIRSGGIRSDSTVILAGSSAGGTGVLINLDRVESLLNSKFGLAGKTGPRVRGISDSGWFIDKLPSYSEKVDCHDVILCPPEISLKKGMNLWAARLPESCQASYPDQPWTCFFGYRIYPTLKASLFVFQWMFDEAQMLVNNVPTPALRKEEWDYVYKVGDELKKTLINVTNVFIPACMAHTVLTHRDWKHVEVNSVFLPRALKCWESGGIVGESNSIPSGRNSQQWEEDNRSSPSSTRLRSPRLQNRINLRHSPDSLDFTDVHSNDSRRNRRRHNRHRQRQASKRERRKHRKELGGDDQTNSGRKRSSNNVPLSSASMYQQDAPIVARRTQRQRKRHDERPATDNNYLNPRNRSRNNLNTNSERQRRRKGSQPESELDSNLAQNHLRNRHKRRNRKKRWYSVCDAGESSGGGSGDIRLIEKCSWPQCNKSCPKLLNPLTGEEVDFKDLLQSFGLDMSSLAKAFGIDITALNNMDHQVLLQMLTQHA